MVTSLLIPLLQTIPIIVVGLLIQFPGYKGSATFWPSGYYGYNRDYDSLRVTSATGFRSPLDQATWPSPSSSSSSSLSSYYQPSSSSYYQPSSSIPTAPVASSRYALPSPVYGNNYYGSSFPFSYYSYMSSLPYYTGSSYPYNEWWKFYSQYPTRSSYSNWPSSSSSNWPSTSGANSNYNYNNNNDALAIHCRYASFYRPGHPTYPYYQHTSSPGSPSSTSSQYYPVYSYGSTSYPFTYGGYKSPSYHPYNYNSYNSYYPPSPSSSFPSAPIQPPLSPSPNYYGLGSSSYGSVQPSAYPPPQSPLPPSSVLPSSSRDLWSQPPVGFGDVDFNRRMGWLGTVPSPANPYAPNYHPDNLFGNTFSPTSSQPVVKSARAVAEVIGPSGVTGTIVFKQIGSRPVSIEGKIMGLTPGPHGMHIYEMPFLGGDCQSAGDHYNPQKTEHGGKHDWNRHIGDLGNIFADANGVASFDLTDLLISLTGGYSIVNRTIAISEKADDLGRGSDVQSKRDGNSGPPIACGIIRLSVI
ncbi:DNA-directed RNA polymerase II subunit RPB1 [Tetranychus urticae]|uniref:Superoxide dismutase copper/zinc binding domain-containing protein n=1 Tax=Tetranychus urticae TaxID=32264 RepID=T1K957_TETUR|nr:DNA-directed RNA polymerase II subunit RPB1 [Tetranychus urticae]